MSARTFFCPRCSAYVPEGTAVCACGFELPAPGEEMATQVFGAPTETPLPPPPPAFIPGLAPAAGVPQTAPGTPAGAPAETVTESDSQASPTAAATRTHQPFPRWVFAAGAGLILLGLVGAGGILIYSKLRSTAHAEESPSFQASAPVPAAPEPSLAQGEPAPVAVPAAAEDLSADSVAVREEPVDTPEPRSTARSESTARRATGSSRRLASAEPVQSAAPPTPTPEQAAAPAEGDVIPTDETAGGGAAVDQFNEANDLIVNIERLSGQIVKAHEQDGRQGDAVWAQLRAFGDATRVTRKEFRRATGTGLAGVMSNVRGIARRNRGGREGDTKILRIKVEDLARRADEIDALTLSAPLGATAAEYWGEVRRNLRRLAALLG